MRSIYGILFGTLFIVFIQASFLDQAISFPDDSQALFNAGTELYQQDDYVKASIFLERAKKCCSLKNEKDLKVKELSENISLNLAHSLVKAEKYQEALTEYKDLYCKFKNPKAKKNIPILEKFLQQQDQQDQQKNKQDQDKEQEQQEQQDQQDTQHKEEQDQNQEARSGQNQDDAKKRLDNQSAEAKDDFDKKNKNKKNQQLDKKQDQKEEKLEQEQQKNKQKEDDPNRDKNQAHAASPPNDLKNSKNQNQNKQKMSKQQILDKDELALLQAIENFDQDMMKMYAAANCGGDEDDGW